MPFFGATVMQPEVPTLYADIPPGASLWGFVLFTGDAPMEMVIAAGKTVKAVRGQFGSHRMTEYSWRNTGGTTERVGIRARVLAGDHDLAAARTEFLGTWSVFAGFGRRATPDKISDRKGGYPYEALFVGFIVYGD
jgi:hypothetical protein